MLPNVLQEMSKRGRIELVARREPRNLDWPAPHRGIGKQYGAERTRLKACEAAARTGECGAWYHRARIHPRLVVTQ